MGPAVVLGKTRNDVIRIRESNPLDGDKGYKLYAPNIGIANDGVLNLVSVR